MQSGAGKRVALSYGVHAFLLTAIHSIFSSFYVDSLLWQYIQLDPSRGAVGSTITVTPPLASTSLVSVVTPAFWAVGGLALLQAAYAMLTLLTALQIDVVPPSLCYFLRWTSSFCRGAKGLFLAGSFGVAWWLPHLPYLPSAVTYTFGLALYTLAYRWCAAPLRRIASTDTASSSIPLEGPTRLYMVAGAAIGSVSVLLTTSLLQRGAAPLNRPPAGQVLWCTTVVALLSAAAFTIVSRAFPLPALDAVSSSPTPTTWRDDYSGVSQSGNESWDFRAFCTQTLPRRSMKVMLAMWTLQEFASAMMTWFFSLMLTVVYGPMLSPMAHGLWMTAAIAAPSLLASLCLSLCSTIGKKQLFSVLFITRAVVGLLALVLAYTTVAVTASDAVVRQNTGKDLTPAEIPMQGSRYSLSQTYRYMAAAVLLANRVLVEVVQEMRYHVLAEVAEEDAVIFGRVTALWAPHHRLASILAVPAQSCALLASAVLLLHSMQRTWPLPSSIPATASSASLLWTSQWILRWVGWHSVIVSLVMWYIWRRWYNLEGKHLQFIRMAVRKRMEEHDTFCV